MKSQVNSSIGEIANLYAQLIRAKKAELSWLIVDAVMTSLQSSQYVREAREALAEGRRHDAFRDFGWAGRYKKMANADTRKNDQLAAEIKKMEDALAVVKEGRVPTLLDGVSVDDLRRQLGSALTRSLTILPFSVVGSAYSLMESVELNIERPR